MSIANVHLGNMCKHIIKMILLKAWQRGPLMLFVSGQTQTDKAATES